MSELLSYVMINPVYMGIGFVWGILVAASVAVFVLTRFFPEKNFSELVSRIKSWWVMIGVFSFAVLSSPSISFVFFGLISFLAFREFISLAPLRRADRRTLFWAYLSIPVQYLLIANQWYGVSIVFIPVWVFFFIPMRLVLSRQTDGFLLSVSMIIWGLMMTVYSVSHAAMLLNLPASETFQAGGTGLILFLAIVNQGNDVAQYVWGKLFGKSKIIPEVSPNKTWAGFVGGIFSSMVLAAVLSGFLTPFSWWIAMAMGGVIAVTGFIGDVVFSAVKRDLKVKDTGSFIPGHGGILDRIDSLCLTAPVFFHLVHFFYF